jgi:hypothetical protein
LGVGETFVSGATVPLYRLNVVLWNAPARIVYEAKSGLSFRFSLHGKRTKEAESGHVVASPICRTCVIERPGTRRTFERGHHKQCNCGRA